MSQWQIHSFAEPPPQVFDAAVTAATDLGFGIGYVDRAGWHLSLTRPQPLSSRGRPFEVAVTDSGLGATLMRVSWEPARGLCWPTATGARCAGRLCRHTRHLLAGEG
ncbi:MAG: hypothetical protein JW785_08170 [Acidimicrobiia bacterium]|nr:hypothetical protein [Acidimicrobiia bacterium]